MEPGGCGTDSNNSAQPAQHCSVAGLGSHRLGLQDEPDAPEQTFPGSVFVVVVFVWGLVVVFLLIMDCDLDSSASSEMFTGLSPFLHK